MDGDDRLDGYGARGVRVSGGAVDHDGGRCGPCAECRAASRSARAPAVALGDHLFKVYVDGDDVRTTRPVTADNAREAAEAFWRWLVLAGRRVAHGRERVIVEHPRGPDVDPSVKWHREGCGPGEVPFVAFVVRVLSVDVAAEVAP